MYERYDQPLLSRPEFVWRVAGHATLAVGIVGSSLAIGMLGYRLTEGLSWIDAFLNAAMLMGGMGPVSELHTTAGKLFAGIYALYSGLIFLVSFGVLAAPVTHRLLHNFNLETPDDDDKPAQ